MEILLSPAKVNLGLWILRKRLDGYHDIFTFMHKVSLYDRIFIKQSPILKIETSNPNIPSGIENIVYKTIKAFEGYTGLEANFYIFIEKNIPAGGGLGGGSSNAAAVLRFLNNYFDNPLSEEELLKLAVSIGSDVPFSFKRGLVKAQGRGEILEETGITYNDELFIVYPSQPSKTAEVYQKVPLEMLTAEEKLPIINDLLGDVNKLLKVSMNTLGEIVKEKLPVVKEVENILRYLGYEPYITGSGSSVFVIGKPDSHLEAICKAKGWFLYRVNFI